ncbi:MAG: YfiR family protein [Gammaproteobacteria bacterium]|nr:MAG: YfiR family protein [Gammaproteobacteria bacterium]
MGLLRNIATRRLWRRLALLLIAGGLLGAAQPVSEYQLKAVFLFNFAQFVEWPPAALPRESAPFVIGVLGKDPFGAAHRSAGHQGGKSDDQLEVAASRRDRGIGELSHVCAGTTDTSHTDDRDSAGVRSGDVDHDRRVHRL